EQPDALTPERVAALLHVSPAIDRVAPALAGAAEVVRRDTRHDRGVAAVVEAERGASPPHVRAVVSDEDRHVADEGDLHGLGAVMERAPLLVEDVLAEFIVCNTRAELRAGSLDGVAVAVAQRRRPPGPRDAAL